MNIHAMLQSPIVARLGWMLLHSLWQGAAICLVTLIALRLLRRHSAAARYGAAFTGLLLMLALPAATFIVLPDSQSPREAVASSVAPVPGVAPASPIRRTSPNVSASAEPPAKSSGIRSLQPAAAPAAAQNNSSDPASAAPAKSGLERPQVEQFLAYAVLAWAIGALLLSLWRLGGWILLQRLRVLGASPVPPEIERLMKHVAARLGVARAVQILATTRLDAPVMMGFLKPVILIPSALLTGLAPHQLEAILAHELAHVRRHDYLALLLQTAVETLLFYHPGVWWLSRHIRLEREQCCDDIAAQATGDRREYASALAAIETCRTAAPALAATGSSAAELVQRIGRLLGVDVPRRPQRLRTALAAILAVLALLVSVSLTAKGQADAAGTITITVKDEKGTPQKGARVQASWPNHDTSGTSDDAGIVKINIGTDPIIGLSLETRLPGYTSPRVAWSPTQDHGAPPQTFDIVIEKTTSIGGVVLDQNGKPLVGASVMLRPTKSYAGSTQSLRGFETVKTNEEGRWEYKGLPANIDSMELGVSHPECLGQYGYVDLKPYKDLAALYAQTAQFKLTRGTPIQGIIEDFDGNPIKNATIGFGEDRVASNVLPEFKANDDGTFAMGVAQGEAVITIKARGFAPELQRVKVDHDPVKLTFRLHAASTVSGIVVDQDGTPLAGVSVFFDTWRGARTLGNRAMTDVAGHWEWTGAPADEMQVDILANNFAANRGVKVKAGDANVTKLTRPTVFRGTVVDAATGEPIKGYQVKGGIMFDDRQPIAWGGRLNMKPGAKAGEFEISFMEQRYSAMVVRVEAAGYEQSDSPKIPVDGKTTEFLFKMVKGTAVEGTLLGVDGKPARNTPVYLMEAGQNISFSGNRFYGSREATAATTNAEGKFQFPSMKGAYRLVAVRDEGVAVVEREEFEKAHNTFKLVKWSRVEGVARVGTKPASNVQIQVSMQIPTHDPSSKDVLGNAQNQATTDADGNFTVDYIYPTDYGSLYISRTEGRMMFQGATTKFKATEGETVKVNVGGQGRPVAGKLGKIADNLKDANVTIMLTSASTFVPMDYPLEVMEMPSAEMAAWYTKYRDSDEFKKRNEALSAAFNTTRSFNTSLQADGTFRFPEVPGGNYTLSVQWQKKPDANGRSDTLAQAALDIAVPDVPGGGASDDAITAPELVPLPTAKLAPGDVLPDLALTTFDGKAIHLSDYRGKYLLIFPWRVAGREFLPPHELQELWDAHKDDRLAILGIANMPDSVRRYVEAHKIPWPSATGNAYSTNLPMFWFPYDKTPFCGFIGPDGKVIALLKSDELKPAVEKALQK